MYHLPPPVPPSNLPFPKLEPVSHSQNWPSAFSRSGIFILTQTRSDFLAPTRSNPFTWRDFLEAYQIGARRRRIGCLLCSKWAFVCPSFSSKLWLTKQGERCSSLHNSLDVRKSPPGTLTARFDQDLSLDQSRGQTGTLVGHKPGHKPEHWFGM